MRRSHQGGRRRARVVFLGLALLGLLSALTGTGAIESVVLATVGPAVQTASSAASGIADFGAGLVRGPALRRQLRSLEAELAQRESERTLYQELQAENQRLRGLLALRHALDFETRAARIVAEESSPVRAFVLDLGGHDGVRRDAAVVSAAGVLGRVIRVAGDSSVVQLLSDSSAGVGVTLQRTRLRAVLVGDGLGRCSLKYVPGLEDVRPGDRLVTSGTDGIYPPGLQVGVVTRVEPGPGFFQRVEVKPSADPQRVSEVLVVLGPESGAKAS